MKFILSLPSGRQHPVQCEPSTQVKVLKEEAAQQTNIDAVQLQFVYEGKKLDDNATIESCNLPEDAKITVMTVVVA